MDLSPITDFFTNVKDKVTNPFFGTLITVSVARNWSLIYSLLNFDSETKLQTKIQYIENYLKTKNFCTEISLNIGYTIFIILISYTFIVAFRSLSTAIEFNLWPYLTGKIVSSKVISRSEFDEVDAEKKEFAALSETQRQRVQILTKDFESLSQNYQTQIQLSTDAQNHNSQLQVSNTEMAEEIKRQQKEFSTIIDSKDLVIAELTKELYNCRQNLNDSGKESMQQTSEINELRRNYDKLYAIGLQQFLENKKKAEKPIVVLTSIGFILEYRDTDGNAKFFDYRNKIHYDSEEVYKSYVHAENLLDNEQSESIISMAIRILKENGFGIYSYKTDSQD